MAVKKSGSDVDVDVPNIVMINELDEWSLLLDPQKVFPAEPIISGLASSADNVFIYARDGSGAGALYKWNVETSYTKLSSANLISERNIATDKSGNVAGIELTADINGDGPFSFTLFKASQNYEGMMY